jgi:hypothetical protein
MIGELAYGDGVGGGEKLLDADQAVEPALLVERPRDQRAVLLLRSRFSSSTFRLYGSRAEPSIRSNRKMS